MAQLFVFRAGCWLMFSRGGILCTILVSCALCFSSIVERSIESKNCYGSLLVIPRRTVDNMMTFKDTFAKLDTGPSAWHRLFMELQKSTIDEVNKLNLSFDDAKSSSNDGKNRYTNVLPYDQNRVSLTYGDTAEDYINASPVDVYEARRKYILSQGPVEETCGDFWGMVWQEKVETILMLNKLVEGGSLKCAKYFPLKEGQSLSHDDFTVTLKEEKMKEDFVVRTIQLQKSGEVDERKILHVQYTEWPDFGVPPSTTHFLDMRNFLKEEGALFDDTPIVIHCSAGIGRTGTFVLADSVLSMIELGTSEEKDIDVNELLVQLRCKRFGLIQTPEQLRFCWMAIVDGVSRFQSKAELSSKDAISGTSPQKRKPVSSTADDERQAKRREMVASMVAKLRASEAARGVPPATGTSRALMAGGAAAVLCAVLYYYYCNGIRR